MKVLYVSVFLNLGRRKNVAQFLNCFDRGADGYLRYTRALILFNDHHSSERSAPTSDRTVVDAEDPEWCKYASGDEVAAAVVRLFPRGSLRTLRSVVFPVILHV